MEPIRVSAKTLDEAITKACIELGVTSESLVYDIVETGSNGLFGIGARPYVISVSVKQEEEAVKQEELPNKEDKLSPKEKAMDFLSSVFEGMGMNVDISAELSEDGRELGISLSGDDMGVLIGKRGQTLDALQYLTGQVINKHSEGYIRVKLDTENYRERRRETLEKLAKNIAHKVKRTKRPVALEPMNPYERRIIHSVLQPDKEVITRSEGEEPYRHVVVALARKKRG
ncbi:MAG TPA: protein jag [Candidatus Avilachnospira avistercoris]|nr:protein jag [Candidatus Avilachnospira avistercoris]